ncbi:MAG: uroporphyrinogen-III synthase [Sulfitobacter sp.]
MVISPLLEIKPLGRTPDTSSYAGFVFTSAHAVEFSEHGDARAAFCVGERTAQAARRHGWDVRHVAKDAAELIEEFAKAPVTAPLLHLAGRHRRGEIDMRLTALGIQTDTIVVYDQIAVPLTTETSDLVEGEAVVILPLFSPRTAVQFRTLVTKAPHVHVIALSQAVADALQGLPMGSLHIVAAPNGHAMQAHVEKLLRKNSLP